MIHFSSDLKSDLGYETPGGLRKINKLTFGFLQNLKIWMARFDSGSNQNPPKILDVCTKPKPMQDVTIMSYRAWIHCAGLEYKICMMLICTDSYLVNCYITLRCVI